MNRINILSEDTSNKIAAGEVVERPFSVVKELVENSIDASSKNISIEIAEGGEKSIKVTDDGTGIYPDDVKKAFLPHATSKIKNIDDIFKINTMGFRGEALPSIAAVSNTILSTRVKDYEYGKQIYISGGDINYVKDTGCNIGTTVEVNDIFYNVPARKKFLKSSQRETAMITDIVERLALAHPDISFKLINNKRKTISTFGTGKIIDTINCIYGKEIVNNIIEIDQDFDTVSVSGYIGNSQISRGSRSKQSIFVNKRPIKSRLITTAVENAYRSFITINKFPFFILFIDIYPEFVDVNVHPSKAEIKFKDERSIFKTVFDSVHTAIRDNLNTSFKKDLAIENDDILTHIDSSSDDKKTIQLPIDLKSESNENFESIHEGSSEYKENRKENFSPDIMSDMMISEKEDKESKLPELNVIGQFHRTYIIAESSDELFLIDQHAAHEKVMFEKYKKQILNDNVVSQILAAPLILELSEDDYVIYEENKNVFLETGFNISNFGNNTLKIMEVPIILGRTDVKGLFMDMIDNLKNLGTGKTTDVKYRLIATTACKAAVKANNRLSIEEINKLITDLGNLDEPFTCPHGRPTVIRFSLYDIEKKFKRVQ